MTRMRRCAVGLLLAAAALSAAAQTYPSKPVRLINAFTPGGPTDLIARLITERMTKDLGVPVVNENRPGAAGNVGAGEVARSAPDGHTALLAVFSIVTSNPHLYPGMPFDPLKDFAPVTALATFDSVLIAHPSVPASNLKELIRSVLAGETQIMFTPTTGALPQIQAGKLKALGVYLTGSIDALPGVPSFAAQGVEGFDARSLPAWYGLVVPAATPREAVARLNAVTVKALRDPEVEQRLRAARIFVIANSPDEFGAMMREGHAAWGRVIRETGVQGE